MTVAPPTMPLDDLLAFPLDGVQVIEASAGTGKTWTLAALYVRLVLGHGRAGESGLLPPQILVMTFTEAATGELRGRIRDRLAQAADAFRRPPPAPAADPFLEALRASCPPADWPRCALQLELAGQWMDEAAIHTIHGWSHRTLRQHAFESASLFRQEKLEDPAGSWLAAARDYWRREVYPLDVAALRSLEKVAASPEMLLEAIAPLRTALARDPQAAAPAVPSTLREALEPVRAWEARCAAAEAAAREAWRARLGELEVHLRDVMAGVLEARRFRSDWREGFLARMREWSVAPVGEGAMRQADYLRFSLRNLRACTRPGLQPPEDVFGVFAMLDELVAIREAGAPVDAVRWHAVLHVTRLYEERKAASASFDFPDLLQRLYHALQAPDGRLAAAVRAQHPVALVDEFQDTDSWQYGALERIYLGGAGGRRGTLVMIGDPKQAIYGFRGADLATYMRARDAADGIHTLTGNHRSTAAVVRAVNHVFGSADRPFDPLPYASVSARREGLQPLQAPDGTALPALTVWHAGGVHGKPAFRRAMAEAFATGIVRLLNDGVLQPSDVAILVADRTEAAAIRGALARRAVRSVYLSDRESVFSSPEANDLWLILRAVSQPRLERHVRAAIATRSFGFAADELAVLLADASAMERQIERFVQWQSVWQRQGLLPMLYRLLHEQQIPARMFASASGSAGASGERRLTNLLHLGDLLQRAGVTLQGEGAVIRHFAERMLEAAAGQGGGEGGADDAQMRLETDAGLVKVVTMHKSKGLQYPVVFLPFASSFRSSRRGWAGRDEAAETARLAEEVRLLYVALTRAERALFVGAASLKSEFPKGARTSRSALGRLLGRGPRDALDERLRNWAACSDVAVAPLPESSVECFSPPASAPVATRPADVPRRSHARPWGSHSFSSMARHASPGHGPQIAPSEADERFADAQADERRPAGAETVTAVPAGADWAEYPRGARYGDLLHRLLEVEVRGRWPVLRAGGPDAAWQARVRAECDALGLAPGARDVLPRWLAAIGNCPLDDAGSRLAQIDAACAWPEMPFLITSRGATARGIDACVRQHVLPGRVRDALQPRALDGLLGGSMDLVFEAGGRWHVLDYKSNRLEAYDRARLEEAILGHRYDLQYSLYLLALHRLLRSRLKDYDYDRHVGGAVYFFVRGIGSPGSGIFVDRPPRAMIDALDAAFQGGPRGEASS